MKSALLLCCLIGVATACVRGGSPAPAPPPPASDATCYFYKSTLTVRCSVGSKSHQCSTLGFWESDENVYGGPTPTGKYLLADRIPYKGVDWHWLHPLIGSKYYHAGFRAPSETRSGFGLHFGDASDGCITVINASCWSGMRSLLDGAKMTRRLVYETPTKSYNTNTIGWMNVRP